MKQRPPLPLLLMLPTVALVLSGLITAVNLGVGAPGFLRHWATSFLVSLLVLPVALVVASLVERFLARPLQNRTLFTKRLLAALMTACLIELTLATVVTWKNLGSAAILSHHWLSAFLTSLPVGIVIALTISFVIKPRFLERTSAAGGGITEP